MKGILFSVREFNILQLIEKGCTSEQIAQKLYISTNTVNTHRRNILQKAHKEHMSELIYELKSMGIL
jgi:DNA-binding NarL/FixJ family response regulator